MPDPVLGVRKTLHEAPFRRESGRVHLLLPFLQLNVKTWCVEQVVAGLSGPVIMSLGLILWEGSWKGSAMMLNAFKNTICSMLVLAIVPLRLETWRHGLGLDLDLREGDSKEDVANINMLLLSSVLGIVISDSMWLAALRILGTRRIVLVRARPLSPPCPSREAPYEPSQQHQNASL